MTSDAERAATEVLEQCHEVQLDSDIVGRTIALRKIARVKTPDAIIAACALARSATLVTRNVDDFKHLTDVSLLDLFASPGGTGP